MILSKAVEFDWDDTAQRVFGIDENDRFGWKDPARDLDLLFDVFGLIRGEAGHMLQVARDGVFQPTHEMWVSFDLDVCRTSVGNALDDYVEIFRACQVVGADIISGDGNDAVVILSRSHCGGGLDEGKVGQNC